MRRFVRPKAELVSVADGQSQRSAKDRRLGRVTPQSSVAAIKALFRSNKPLDWADIRLPAVTRLNLTLYGQPSYNGGAAFLTAHTALTALRISTLLVSVGELTAIFRDPTALPLLTHFGLFEHDHSQRREMDLAPLVTALATAVVGVSGSVRPMEILELHIGTTSDGFAVAALMPQFTALRMSRVRAGWVEEWNAITPLPLFPLLQELDVHSQ